MATKKSSQSNQKAVIGICAAILINHRNSKMNLVQKLSSLILYAGHTSKQVYKRLQRLHVNVSHSSLIRLLERVGKNFDEEVLKWKRDIMSTLDTSNEIQTQVSPWCSNSDEQDTTYGSSDDDNTESESDSDLSWQSMSPVTSDDDDSDYPSTERSSGSSDEEELSDILPGGHLPDTSMGAKSSTCIAPTNSSTSQISGSQDQVTLFHICGDNIDHTIKQRYMRVGKSKPDEIHYFHSYAVSDRVDFSGLSERVVPTMAQDPEQVALSLFPTAEDDLAIRSNMCTLISRIIYENMEFARLAFDGVVNWHITHEFYSKMSRKSVVVPLGIQPKNENKTEDMICIMQEFHKYVPMIEFKKNVYVPSINKNVEVVSGSAHMIQFSGDQKTVARARGAQLAKVNAATLLGRLVGLVPAVADWHTKVKLLDVVWKYFYSYQSASEHGTLYQLRNKLNRTNVVKTPKKDVNACEDFLNIVTSGLVVTAVCTILQLQSVDEHPTISAMPNADEMWTMTADERKQSLKQLCEQVFDRFVDFRYNAPLAVVSGGDKVFEYSVQLLRLGLFYLEFADAIREGDGNRVLRCWKYMLPIFSASGSRNYTCEAANLLIQYSYTLPPRLAQQLLWSRFVNIHGRPGHNVPVDLHMEHLNKIAKGAISFLGSNKSVKAITRIGQSIGTLYPLLNNFYEDNDIQETSSTQRRPRAQKDIAIVVKELLNADCLRIKDTKRKHSHFPRPRDNLRAKEKCELLQWLIGKLPTTF